MELNKEDEISNLDINKDKFNEKENCPTLTKEEQNKLIQSYKNGDLNALNKLYESYHNFIYYILNSKFSLYYYPNSEYFDDLTIVSYKALISSCRNFDPTLNIQFSTFFGETLINMVKDKLKTINDSFTVPIRLKNEYYDICKKKQELDNKTLSDNSLSKVNEIYFHNKPFSDEKLSMFENLYNGFSLNDDTNINHDLNSEVIANNDDSITSKNETNKLLTLYKLRVSMYMLTSEEIDIIAMKYSLYNYNKMYSLEEIGKKYSISAQAVKQKIDEIIAKIRKIINIEY